MGSRTYNRTEKPKKTTAYDALMLHPNFKMPNAPELKTGTKLESIQTVNFVIEAVANFVSPPKIVGENDELSCNDVAEEIRTNLRVKVLKALNLK